MNDHPWAWAGCVMAAASSAFAFLRARATAASSYYADEVYGLSPARHRQFAIASAVVAAVFLSALIVPAIPVVPLLGLYSVGCILYFASFVRGATGEDE